MTPTLGIHLQKLPRILATQATVETSTAMRIFRTVAPGIINLIYLRNITQLSFGGATAAK